MVHKSDDLAETLELEKEIQQEEGYRQVRENASKVATITRISRRYGVQFLYYQQYSPFYLLPGH